MTDRAAATTRETGETTIEVTLELDGSGTTNIDTGVGFFDHMLASFAAHGLFDLTVSCDGDLEIDDHHTIEDVGIVLGQAFDDALGERVAIERFADRRVPLDEAVADVVVDLSGRPRWYFDGTFSQPAVGDMTSDMARHFFESFTMRAGITMHAAVTGDNAHHEIEALFKGVARALDDATRIDDRRSETPSTKGEL